jgi:hypothetical protein
MPFANDNARFAVTQNKKHFYLVLKIFINHVRGSVESVRQAGLGPQAVVWTALA